MAGFDLIRLLFSPRRRSNLTSPVLPSIETERQKRQEARLQLREALEDVRAARLARDGRREQ